MIECGWCGQPSAPDRCGHCHRDPAVPWRQRGLEPVPLRTDAVGRPALDPDELRHRFAVARKDLGEHATVDALAERLDVSPKTVRRWLARIGDQ